jgi:hypothetical protein
VIDTAGTTLPCMSFRYDNSTYSAGWEDESNSYERVYIAASWTKSIIIVLRLMPQKLHAYQYVDDDTDHIQEISRTYNHPEISEIKDGIYRISGLGDFGITYNQFLIDDDQPTLIQLVARLYLDVYTKDPNSFSFFKPSKE